MWGAFQNGASPVEFISSGPPPVKPQFLHPTPQPPPDQPEAVKADPRYQLNTGVGCSCPFCGSTNIRVMGKEGSGLGYFGSIPFVVGAMVVESLIQSAQDSVLQCGYCENNFQLRST
jgi:hypothetical protein